MKLASGFAALLIATSVIVGGVISGCGSQSGNSEQAQNLEPLKPLKVEQIDKIASEITVLIDTSSSGSGVLIAKERGWFDTTYYVLTAKHVIQGKNEFDIVTPDGERYRRSQNDVVEYLPDADLAVVQFKSNKQYSFARLSNWNFQDRSAAFDATLENVPWAFVSGFPDPKQENNFQLTKRLFTIGIVSNATDAPFGFGETSIADGYEFRYGATTYQGMSGSPILDASGRLVGIHGRNSGEFIEANRRIILGYSIGVPINKLIQSTSEKLQKIIQALPIDKNPPLSTVNDPRDYVIAFLVSDWYYRVTQKLKYDGKYKVTAKFEEKDCRDDLCLNFVNSLIRANFYDDAFRLIQGYLSIDRNRNFYPAWYLKADILHKLGRNEKSLPLKNKFYEEALLSLDESVRLNPDFYEARITQCWILSSQKSFNKAIEACNKSIEIIARLEKNGKLKFKSFRPWHQKAVALAEKSLFKESIENSNIAISIFPNPHSYLNRGATREKLGDYKGAIEDYKQAIRLNPNYTQGYINRAFAKLDIADIKGANQDFDIAAKINIEYTAKSLIKIKPLNFSGSFQKLSDNEIFLRQKTNEIYSNLISQNSNSPNLSDLYKTKCILQSEFDIKGAVGDCNKSIELNPSSLDAYRIRGSLYRELGDYQKSVNDYTKQIDLLSPVIPSYYTYSSYYGRCKIYVKLERYDLALQDCQMAIKNYPISSKKDKDGLTFIQEEMFEKAYIYNLIAQIYHKLNNSEMAVDNISSAIKIIEFNGYYYIDRAAYRFGLLKILKNKDTNEIISLAVDSIDDAMKVIEDLEKASNFLRGDDYGKEFLKKAVKSYRESFSSIQQQDETVQAIIVKLKKLE